MEERANVVYPAFSFKKWVTVILLVAALAEKVGVEQSMRELMIVMNELYGIMFGLESCI